MKLFYDHLILELDDVYAHIDRLEVSDTDKRELHQLVEETTHHTILDTILSRLDKQFHTEFLERFHSAPYDLNHLEYLKDKIADIDTHIIASARKLKTTLLKKFRSRTK